MIEMETIEQGKADDSRGSGVGLPRLVRHLDLFSGIGGFALAARMVGGIETVGFCEIDPWAQKVLAKNFPGVPIHDDVKTLNPENYGRIDLISGGYPCQPFSHAGERRGAEDDRHLWPAMRRVIESAMPRWVLAENVAGHISLGLDEVLSELESIGYTCGTAIIPACAVDARHRRDRLWICAYANSGGQQKCKERNGGKNQSRKQPPFGGNADRLRDALADAQRPERGEANPAWVNDQAWNGSDGIPRREEIPSGTRGGCRWEPEPSMGRVAYGIPRRVDRLRSLGNAIVPQVAETIFRAIKAAESV